MQLENNVYQQEGRRAEQCHTSTAIAVVTAIIVAVVVWYCFCVEVANNITLRSIRQMRYIVFLFVTTLVLRCVVLHTQNGHDIPGITV